MKTGTPITKLLMTAIVLAVPLPAFSQMENFTVTDKFGNELRVQLDVTTGSPHRIYDLDATVGRYGKTMESLSKENIGDFALELLADYEEVIGVSASNLRLRKAKLSNEGQWHISYQQTHNGVPVYRAKIGFTVESTGAIHRIGGDIYPKVAVDTSPTITREDAIRAAIAHFNPDNVIEADVKEPPKLFIYPQSDSGVITYFLTYRLKLFSAMPLKEIIYFVDGHSGNILNNYSAFRHGEGGGLLAPKFNVDGYLSRGYYPQHHYNTPLKSADYVGQQVQVNKSPIPDGIFIDHTSASGYYDVLVN